MTTLSESQTDTNSRQRALIDALKATDRQGYLFAKRVFDLFICLGGLPAVLCLIAFFATAIVLDSPGSPFFIQERVGKDGRRFRMYKFRTLRCDYNEPAHRLYMQTFVLGENDASLNSPCSTGNKPPIQNDITRVGNFLRKNSLDELPQIFNVLKGEMSLIGPRPNVTWEVEIYKEWHYARLGVLPGITGLAQVRGRSNITFDEIVRNDLEYIQKQSFKLDLQILWWTILGVIGGEGAG